MGKNSTPATIDSTPVRSTMTDLLTHLQCLLAELMRLLLDVKYCYDSTHNPIYDLMIYNLRFRDMINRGNWFGQDILPPGCLSG